MDLTRFEKYSQECSEKLPGEIDKILKKDKDKRVYAVGFITTDDFYGCYLAWDYENHNLNEYYDWKEGLEPEFLYQPLVDVVDACKEIDFTRPSNEKWKFAEAFLTVLAENIKQIPDEVFDKNNYKREDILFFATMGDGDYIQEMLDASVKMFNAPESVEAL